MPIEKKLPYDKTSAQSILDYALQLKDKTLRDLKGSAADKKVKGKGGFGQLVEEVYFGYKPNSTSEPDFPEAGVELKTSPIIRQTKKFAAKERLVLNVIDYMTEHGVTFETSSFWRKNAKLLLMMYLHETDKLKADLLFKIICLWEFPAKDLEIIKDDWNKIIEKIKKGKAHELSEGDTLYLAACTKGAKGKDKSTLREQPFGPKAAQRAYSLKQSYMNTIVMGSGIQKDFVPFVKDASELKKKTFEQLVQERFQPYYGMTEEQIRKSLDMPATKAKNSRALLAFAIMGAKGKKKIEEFEKAGIQMKTVVLKPSGVPTEDMSFAQIDYEGIVQETWKKSYWFDALTKRFFFVVFRKTNSGAVLEKVFFWTMPVADLKKARVVWEHTKNNIADGVMDSFITSKKSGQTFIRTKGANSKDMRPTPSGVAYKKLGYWLYKLYIKDIIKAN